MSALEHQLAEDKALRDAALLLLKTDISLVRDDLSIRGIGTRIVHRVSDAAMDMADDGIEYIRDNRGLAIGAGVGAIVLWFSSRPLLNKLSSLFGATEDDTKKSICDEEPDRFVAR